MRAFVLSLTLCAVASAWRLPAALAQDTVAIPHAAYTGETYQSLDIVSRGFYLGGLLDGLLGAPLLGAGVHLTETLHQCLLRFHPAQTVAIVDKYVAAHPADLPLDMHILALQALRGACPEFDAEFRHTMQPAPRH